MKTKKLRKMFESAGSNDKLRTENFNNKINDLIENKNLNHQKFQSRIYSKLSTLHNSQFFSVICLVKSSLPHMKRLKELV